jgi:hypothetical protein
VPVEQLGFLAEPEADRLWPGFWFHRRLLGRTLQPVCQIEYLRTARIGMAEGFPVRMTLDRELKASAISSERYDESGNGTPLVAGAWIMELKYRHALPALFKRLVTELAPAPQRLSKYRLAVHALGLTSRREPVSPSRVAETADA